MKSNPAMEVARSESMGEKEMSKFPVPIQFDVTANVYVCFDDEDLWEERADWLETCRMYITSLITHQKARRHVNIRSLSVRMHEASMETIEGISVTASPKQCREWNKNKLPYAMSVDIAPFSNKEHELLFNMLRCALAGMCAYSRMNITMPISSVRMPRISS